MSVLKTYSIQNDITGQKVASSHLHSEIIASGSVTGFEGVAKSGDTVSVIGTALANETALDALVLAHSDLPALKTTRYAEIDAKTDELIDLGFTFDGKQFSLTVKGQHSIRVVKENNAADNVTTKDHDTYALTQPNVNGYYNASIAQLKVHKDSGRVLKKSVFDAVDTAAVNAIVDTR
jgi:hypothetical protein